MRQACDTTCDRLATRLPTEKGRKRPHTEAAFETAIEHHPVISGGYATGEHEAFDRDRCIDPQVFLAFVQETQPKEWEYLKNLQKDKAEETLLDDLCRLNSAAVTGEIDVREQSA